MTREKAFSVEVMSLHILTSVTQHPVLDPSFIMNILSKDTKTINRPRKENKKKNNFFYKSGFISFP